MKKSSKTLVELHRQGKEIARKHLQQALSERLEVKPFCGQFIKRMKQVILFLSHK